MSKKQEVEVVDLKAMTKKQLKDLELQLDVQQKFLEMEKAEINLDSIRLSFESQVEKRRFDIRGIPDGVLRINDEISENFVDYLAAKVDAFVHAHRHLTKKERPGLTVEINSPGGSVFEGWRLFDELRAASYAGHKVTTKVRGVAASMAAVMAQAGDIRLIGPESYMMIHEPSTMAWGKAFEVKEQALLVERLSDQMAKKFAERSGKTSKQMKLLFERTDAWFSAEECIKHGFADGIG